MCSLMVICLEKDSLNKRQRETELGGAIRAGMNLYECFP